jgi:putative DNA primase/helicase
LRIPDRFSWETYVPPDDDFDEVPHPAEAGAVNDGNVVPIERARRKRKVQAEGGERTELQLSELLVEGYRHELRYCGPLGGWFSWCGTHWRPDVLERARECVKDIARRQADEAAATLDDQTFKSAKRAGSAGGVSAILDLARSAPGIVFAPEDADRDPWALACASGVIDLRTGKLRRHDRAELITRASPVAYDPSATAPRFDRFLAEIQPDPEVRAYLARLCGYAAVGVVREHVLGVLWGPGANGKSVFADIVTHVLGDYARPGPSTLIVANGQHEPHPTDVASCVGSRLVIVHETKRGASFDSSKVKLLTGGDRLTARHMREDFFQFTPSHTLVMLSNYRPSADSSDAAFWRRVLLLPFNVVIPPERRDPLLSEALRQEAPGVLRWIVEGALEWQRLGLAPPAVVLAQTEQYRASEDVIGQFLEECTVRLPAASAKAGALYEAFKSWCSSTGQRVVRGNDFAAEILARGFERVKRASGLVYLGVGLTASGSEEE